MNVFVSSVVGGFEAIRAAARRAIEMVDGTPIMCEDFGARPYSPERACLTEIDGSEVFVIILGERYGFEQSHGISVTQQEFRHAISLPIPVLVFIQDGTMEPKQGVFRAEVENYHSGFCRVVFSSPEDLKEKLTQNLHRLGRARTAISEADFQKRLKGASTQLFSWSGSRNEATFLFSFLPQPRHDIDLRHLVDRRDKTFGLLSDLGLASLRDGYEPIDERDNTGLKSRNTILRQYEDGLLTLEGPATLEAPGISFGSWYVPPSNVRRLGQGCFHLIQSNGGWSQVGLNGMDNAVMSELPKSPTNSFSMAHRGDKEGFQNKLLIPCTQSAFNAWLDTAVSRLERQFGPR
jgi:hypothetical protein